MKPAQHAEPSEDGLTVYYDASCPLCRSEIGLYQGMAADCPVDFVDVSRAAPEEAVAPGLTGADAMARFHVRDGTGLHSGAAGFGRLWLHYRGFRWLGRLLRLRPVRWLAELAYRAFLVTLRPLMQRFVRWRARVASS